MGTFEEIHDLLRGLLASGWVSSHTSLALTSAQPDLARDAPVCCVFALAFFIFNWGTRLLLVEPCARHILGMSKAKATKCAQSVMEAAFYGCFTCLGLLVVPSQASVWPSENWWIGFASGGHEIMRIDVRCYYLLYMSRYAQMVVSVFLEPKRKDFVEMLVHHIVTVVVIFVSYVYGWNRVGVVVMLLMDAADVPLHLAKICKYLAETTKFQAWQLCADGLFVAFLLTFFVTRLVLYSYVVWSASVEGPRNIPNAGGPPGWTCLVLLHLILYLQFYWMYLIVKVAVRLLLKGAVEDVRSDDEDEDPKEMKTNRSNKGGSYGHMLILAVPCLVLLGWECRVSFGTTAKQAAVVAELRVLLGGLVTMFTNPTSAVVAALPSAPPDLPRDRAVFGIFTVAFFLLNWGTRLAVVEPLVRNLLGVKPAQVQKFAQSAIEAAFYGVFTVIGLIVVPAQVWVWPSAKWWIGFADGGHEIMRSDLRCYYIMYVARYAQGIVSVFLEPKRKDFLEMVIHHVVTVVVIFISYVYGWNRIGAVVMVLLDPGDVPLHLAKLCKYTAEATQRQVWQFLADRLFEVFAVVFFVTRLCIFSYVCWSAHIEATRYFPKGLPEWTCVALLYTLLLLQMWWFLLIIKVALKILQGHAVDDPRSDDEDEGGNILKSETSKKVQ